MAVEQQDVVELQQEAVQITDSVFFFFPFPTVKSYHRDCMAEMEHCSSVAGLEAR